MEVSIFFFMLFIEENYVGFDMWYYVKKSVVDIDSYIISGC